MAGNPRRNFFGTNGKLISAWMQKYPRNNPEEGNGVYFDIPNRLVLYFTDLKQCQEEKILENKAEATVEVWVGRDVISCPEDWGFWGHFTTYKFTNLKFKSYMQDNNFVKVEYTFDMVRDQQNCGVAGWMEQLVLPVATVKDFTRYPRPVLTGEAILAMRRKADPELLPQGPGSS